MSRNPCSALLLHPSSCSPFHALCREWGERDERRRQSSSVPHFGGVQVRQDVASCRKTLCGVLVHTSASALC
eukprot:scaffold142618_cov19-Tisochrysis_lutea.AAC.1